MKRVIALTILIILSFILQTTLFSFHSSVNIAPNLLLIITMSFGIMRGRREGMLVGLFSGFLYDVFFGSLIGPFMLIYMIIGYVNGFFHRNYLMEDVLLPVIIITFDELVFEFVVYVFFFLLRNRTELGYYFVHAMLPQLLYTVLITIIIYRVYVIINKWLKKKKNIKVKDNV